MYLLTLCHFFVPKYLKRFVFKIVCIFLFFEKSKKQVNI
jgi:hypothetical protein